MNKAKLEPIKENFWSVFGKHNVVLSMSLSDGWANIEVVKDYKGNETLEVKFMDEEGRGVTDECGDGGLPLEDVEKVAAFIKALRDLKLEDYQRTV